MKQQAANKFHADIIDPGEGRHLWIMTAIYEIKRPELLHTKDYDLFLDLENLITLEGVGCFKCEKIYSGNLAGKPCKGALGLMPDA